MGVTVLGLVLSIVVFLFRSCYLLGRFHCGPLKIPYAFSDTGTYFGEFAGAEDYHDYYQDNNKFRHAYTKHFDLQSPWPDIKFAPRL